MSARIVLLILGIVSSGLIAGLFFGWSVSVIPGLGDVDDTTYITTMQSINVRIVNPAFVIPFMVTPLVLAAAAAFEFRSGNHRRTWVLGAAAATYAVGVLGVTVGGNIPLNNALDAFNLDAASARSAAERRTTYEGPWNRWHLVRTVLSVAAFSLAAVAATISEDPA